MLPTQHDRQYQKLSQLLDRLQETVAKRELKNLLAINNEVQKFFETDIMSLDNSELDPSVASQLQSYVTEIHKQLRLLNVDVTFLQASRNSQTTETRLTTVKERLETLKGYCLTIVDRTKLTQNQEQT